MTDLTTFENKNILMVSKFNRLLWTKNTSIYSVNYIKTIQLYQFLKHQILHGNLTFSLGLKVALSDILEKYQICNIYITTIFGCRTDSWLWSETLMSKDGKCIKRPSEYNNLKPELRFRFNTVRL